MNWQAKGIIAVVVLAIIGGLVFWVKHDSKVITQQTVTNAQQTTVINTQNTTIKQDASSAAITDTVTASAAAVPGQVQDTQTKIDASTDAQIKAITQKYAGQNPPNTVTFTPTTPSSPNAKPAPVPAPVATTDQPTPEDVEISQVRITGVWQTYCAGNPSDPDCASVPAPLAQ
jgi:hypothetical protein